MSLKKTMFAAAVACAVGIASVPAPAAGPTSRPATSAQSDANSPAKLGEMLRQMREERAARAKVAHIDIGSDLAEKPAGFALFSEAGTATHYSVLKRLKQARDDKDLAAVLVTVSGDGLATAQAQELRDALAEISATGRPTYVYADRYSTSTYTLATGATNICILPGGEMLMPGIALETMFARGLLDKLGVKADMVQIGEYKGASEALTRMAASDELKGELDRLVDGLYQQVVTDIVKRRGIPRRDVQAAIDRAWLPAADALAAKLVDHVVDIDGMRELIADKVGNKVDLLADYGVKKQNEVDFSSPFALLQMLSQKPSEPEGPAVALVYVDGMIVEGEGSDSLFGDGVAADGPIRSAMRISQRDPNIKAVVIRIDSPGGSALASEAAWQAIRRLAKDKPVVVSVGGMAASGGYYIACAGDRIFADPSAVIGSIGVVGGKMSLAGLYEKLGIASETFSRGANAAMFSSSTPFTDSQRIMLGNLMRQTYDQFIDRVLQTRKGKIGDIDKVARGRIFAGSQAAELGLVDEIGGLTKALDFAAGKGGLPKDYAVRVVPSPKTLADMLTGDGAATEQIHTIPLEVRMLPPGLRRLAVQQLAAMEQLQASRMMLIPPVMMQVK